MCVCGCYNAKKRKKDQNSFIELRLPLSGKTETGTGFIFMTEINKQKYMRGGKWHR